MSESLHRPPLSRRSSKVLGTLLLERGALSSTDLERLLEIQRETGERLGELAVRTRLVEPEVVARALSDQLGLPFLPGPLKPEPSAVRLVRGAFARQRRVVPIDLSGRILTVATADPLDLSTVDDLQFLSGRRVRPVVTTPSAVRDGLRLAYEGEVTELARQLPGSSHVSPRIPGRVAPGPDEAPLIRLVDLLLRRSIEGGASDLHVEQEAEEVVIRERVDGILRRVTQLPTAVRTSFLARVKVLAGMDISVKRRPQDGGFALTAEGRTLSVRVSTLPVEGGEKAVLRFLDPRAAPRNLAELGFSEADLGSLRKILRGGQGVVLATGPTGSGKTSTLFGALGEVDRECLNVVTLEDPIEYRLDGISQVQVNPRSGLTFPAALRSVLRQDPDVVMVGEIRDRETAEIAMSAAITGHLVLSTLHTIDAPATITRLLQMDVQPHLIAGGLAGIIAQRLVRRRCRRCRGTDSGCRACHGGYHGRTGVFQILTVTDELREAITSRAGATEIRRRAEAAGMKPMSADAGRKVSLGITDPPEVARVLGDVAATTRSCSRCGETAPSGATGCSRCGWPRARMCVCDRVLDPQWHFCPDCLRRAPAMPT